MRRAWFLVLLVACKASDDGDDFPVVPGGPSVPSTIVDAAPPDTVSPDGGMTITGRVCIVSDIRTLTPCGAAQGITVTLGTRTTTTGTDGTFTIPAPSSGGLVWRAAKVGFVSSVVPFGVATTIPMIDEEAYLALQNANGVVLSAGQGSIAVRVIRNGAAQAGAVATVQPFAEYPVKYDGPTSLAWTQTSTGAAGAIWVPGAVLGTNIVTVTPTSGNGASASVLVEDQAITYTTIELP